MVDGARAGDCGEATRIREAVDETIADGVIRTTLPDFRLREL